MADYSAIYQQILAEGHTTGNHTMHHLNGWKTNDDNYLNNIDKANELINSKLFRPPYGRIKWSQIKKVKSKKAKVKTGEFAVKNQQAKIIMWSVLSADFDMNIDGEQCYQNVIKSVQPGSIIVFHDSAKALPRLQYALPKVLQWLQEKGYTMKALPLY